MDVDPGLLPGILPASACCISGPKKMIAATMNARIRMIRNGMFALSEESLMLYLLEEPNKEGAGFPIATII